jgi:chitodextrinase
MWGAARPRRVTAISVFVLAALAAASPAASAPDAGRAAPLPANVWALELDRASASRLAAAGLRSYRGRGFNAVVADTRRLSARPAARVRTAAGRAKLLVLAPRTAAGLRACAAAKRRAAVPRCAVSAPNAAAAARLARSSAADLVVVRLTSLGQLRFLRGLKKGRVLALVPLGSGRLNARAWSSAVDAAKQDTALDLGLSLRGKVNAAALNQLGRLIRAQDKDVSGDDDPPATPPPAPTGLALSGNTATSVTLAWHAAPAGAGVSEYGLYRDGTAIGSVANTVATFAGLACNTSYLFEIDAVNVAGGRSSRTPLRASTLACGGGGGGGGGGGSGGADTTPPTLPVDFRRTGATTTSVAVAWSAADDNVAVTGYSVYRDGTRLFSPTAAARAYTFINLACGRSYTLEIDAFDAAGNRSPRATVTATTNACAVADTQAPTAPTALAKTGGTATSVSVSWGAASDNVAVTGYGLYRNGQQTSSAVASARSHTFSGLACGTTYTFQVDATDAAGNRSAKASLDAATAECGTADTQSPTTPAGLHVTGTTATSISVAWAASTDNDEVSGYGLYRGASHVATGTSLTHTFGSLSCGTTYTLGVDAYDPAGNRSAKASVGATTAACSGPGGGSAAVFLSPSGSDANPCTQAAPCRSLERGLTVATAGAVVELAGGTYSGGQVVPDVSRAGAARIVVRPAPGAQVTFAEGLSVRGDHVEVTGVTVGDDVYVRCGVDDFTFRDSKASLFFVRSATNISFVDVEFGPSHDISQIGHTEDCQFSPDNILMDRVYMHDFWWDGTAQSTNHMECLTLQASNNFTLRNSRFHRCEDFGLFIKHRHPVLHSTNLVIENNFFDKPWPDGSYGISFSEPDSGGTYENVLIRNNSFVSAILLRPEITWRNLQVVGNVGVRTGGDCGDYVSRYNVWSAMDPCHSTDLRAPSGFVNAAGFDLHLRPDSVAVGHGDPSNHPSSDIDGQARPQGGAPDAGADER